MSDKQLTLDDLDYFWMPSGVPCFLANQKDICDIIESFGFQIYYLITNDFKETQTTTTTYNTPSNNNGGNKYYGYGANNPYTSNTPTTTTTTKVERSAKIFKVVNNFVGRTVSISNDEFPQEFMDLEEECTYTMPLIPLDIVNKLDEFFRLVHSQHGTESIVILTYDTTKKGSEGWGVLVPEQTNTAAHCKYDADSIASIKPDNVMIVGSVHSHPEMAAYASGTDHEDQADFDGIHITYGWQKHVNNGATQYYAELQMAGKNYKLDIEDVFETVTLAKDPDPEVVEWSTKVKKAFPPYQGGSSLQPATTHHSTSSDNTTTGKQAGGFRSDVTRNILLSGTNYHSAIKDLGLPADSVIIAEVDLGLNGSGHCLVCEYPVDEKILSFGRCDVCDSPLASTEDHVSTIVEKVEQYLVDYYLPFTTPVYLFSQDNGKPLIMRMNDELSYYTGTSQKKTEQQKAVEFIFPDKDKSIKDSDSDYVHIPSETVEDLDSYEFDYSFMLCCGVRISDAPQDCYCQVKIYPGDLNDFDSVLRTEGDIYTTNANCHDCANFYMPKCPAYRELLTEFVRTRTTFSLAPYVKSINGCTNFIHYTQVFVQGKEQQYNGA